MLDHWIHLTRGYFLMLREHVHMHLMSLLCSFYIFLSKKLLYCKYINYLLVRLLYLNQLLHHHRWNIVFLLFSVVVDDIIAMRCNVYMHTLYVVCACIAVASSWSFVTTSKAEEMVIFPLELVEQSRRRRFFSLLPCYLSSNLSEQLHLLCPLDDNIFHPCVYITIG